MRALCEIIYNLCVYIINPFAALFCLFWYTIFPSWGGESVTLATAPIDTGPIVEVNKEVLSDAARALQTLGQTKTNATAKAKEILLSNPDFTVEEVVIYALKNR